ncbi:hypothetical protein VNO78_23871 [Psophocarpus tetragonolobus]|uniref:E2 ubiquitin-conjugating enzyme n=1 Tax=Psophocarpus tetragonolobus TaxID=3891 RepID=A0AAN9XES9_PSOTE
MCSSSISFFPSSLSFSLSLITIHNSQRHRHKGFRQAFFPLSLIPCQSSFFFPSFRFSTNSNILAIARLLFLYLWLNGSLMDLSTGIYKKFSVLACVSNGHSLLQKVEVSDLFIIMSSPSKRREMDVMKLMMSDYTVETINDGLSEFNVEFHGPKESLYEGGVWKIRVELPDAYPYKSPSIGFVNKIFHPNVDELSGSVCLDVINQSWSPMFDLLNVFEVFLPQLLLYPNASDPLNGDAASLMMKDKKLYDQKVKEYCERYAKKENITNTAGEESEDEEDISEEESGGSSDDDIPGHADP